MGSIELIRNIAHKLAAEYKAGDGLVLVVSAMAKTTDYLFDLAHGITDHPSRREMDMLLTAGERISMSLLSLALQVEGIQSISFTGSQSGIITDDKHGNARILKVNAFRIHEELAKGKVVIVAGFQGVSQAKEITTLGRGGSDTSAVALACYLGADKCEIYTDVDGVYTADPRIVPHPFLLRHISADTMLNLCYNGSKVLHPRAVEFAYKYGVQVEIKSSFSFAPGSLMSAAPSKPNKEEKMEERVVTAIAHKDKLIRYRLLYNAEIDLLLADWTHEIFKSYYEDKYLDLYVESKYQGEIDYLLKDKQINNIDKTEGLGFVILVGLGLGHDPALLAKVLRLCSKFEVLRSINTEKSIELLMPAQHLEAAVQHLHKAFIEDKHI